MNLHTFCPSFTKAILLLVFSAFSNESMAQTSSLKDQIVGTWKYVLVDNIRPDGSRVPLFGSNPQGRIIFDSNSNYVLMTSRAHQEKFAAGSRDKGTNDENRAAVQGSIAHFGRYDVSDADKTIVFHIETSTFPNWSCIDQKRPFSISGDELKWKTPSASSGGLAEVVLKRLR
jgi:hypothetical protein